MGFFFFSRRSSGATVRSNMPPAPAAEALHLPQGPSRAQNGPTSGAVPRRRVIRVGLSYGLTLSIWALVVIIVLRAAQQVYVSDVVLAILYVLAGFLAARTNGSVWSGVLASIVLAGISASVTYAFLYITQAITVPEWVPPEGITPYHIGLFLGVFGVVGLPGIMIGSLSAAIGRAMYKRNHRGHVGT